MGKSVALFCKISYTQRYADGGHDRVRVRGSSNITRIDLLYMNDDDYIDIVDSTLERLLYQFEPDLVLYDAGVDVWEHDDLGKLNISWQGIEERDRLVLDTCLKRGTPVATVIGGGYDKDHARLARRHAIVVEQAYSLIHSNI